MQHLRTFESFTNFPTLHVNQESKLLIIDNVLYDFNFQKIGTVPSFDPSRLNEDITANDLWSGIKSAATWVKDSMWSTLKPPLDAKLTDSKGLLEWGHYILGVSSLVLGLSGVGALVASAIDLVDGSIHFAEGAIRKFKLNDQSFEPFNSIIAGGITIGFAVAGGRAASGAILSTLKSESKEIAAKLAAGTLSKEAAVKVLLGKNNREKTIRSFVTNLENQTIEKKILAAFTTFVNFIKEIPAINKAAKMVWSFATNLCAIITEAAKKVVAFFHSVFNQKVAAKAPAAPKPAAGAPKPAVAATAKKPVVNKAVAAAPVKKPVATKAVAAAQVKKPVAAPKLA